MKIIKLLLFVLGCFLLVYVMKTYFPDLTYKIESFIVDGWNDAVGLGKKLVGLIKGL
ncbi:MAG: hypothetical protein ACLRFI_01520 [Alphaproteobacteria bacterium]